MSEFNNQQQVTWKSLCLWCHLFRAFRIAIDFRKLLLASVGLLLISLGNWGLSCLPFAPESTELQPMPWEFFVGDSIWPRAENGNDVWGVDENFAQDLGGRVQAAWSLITLPISPLFESGQSWQQHAFVWSQLLWAIVVWSVIGGALARMAALQFAADARTSVRTAVKFSLRWLFYYLTAPLLPFIGIGFLGVLIMIGGLIGRVPVAGELFVGLFWLTTLLIGLGMSLIVLGVIVGWPLMISAISTEGSDGFDGLSRAYSYLFNKPWHYLWYAIVAFVYGVILMAFVAAMTHLIGLMTVTWMTHGIGPEKMGRLTEAADQIVLGMHLNIEGLTQTEGIAAAMLAGWSCLFFSLPLAFACSFFWTACTIIYFLLRYADDSVLLTHVYLEEDEEEQDELLPLVGVADSDQPVIERPVVDAPQSPTVATPDEPTDTEPTKEDSGDA